MVEDFNDTIDIWIEALEHYSFAQLYRKPSQDGWSIGQVYMHLIENTEYYIEQIKTCLGNNDNEFEEASPSARTMFLNNDFPDELIEGPPSNNSTPQPESKKQLLKNLFAIKNEMSHLYLLMSASGFRGKTKHPGLLYLNAREWFQFAEMHFRHHLRQKKRIDEFLKSN